MSPTSTNGKSLWTAPLNPPLLFVPLPLSSPPPPFPPHLPTSPTNPSPPPQGGTFTLHLVLPRDYPFKPPTLTFRTKIYHPNVTNDDKGSMCLGMLRADEWKPSSKIVAVLDFARQLLVEPMPDDAVEAGIAQLYKEDRKEWTKRARGWVKLYASKP